MNTALPFPLQLFVFGDNTELGTKVAKFLKVKPSGYTITKFADGERLPHQTETVRDKDVFIILTSVNGDKIGQSVLDYLAFIHSVKQGQPNKITIMLPKLTWQRQDVENRNLREPVMANFFPKLCKAAGADRIMVCKLHNPASKTEEPPMENIGTDFLIVEQIKKRYKDLSKIALASADISGAKYVREIAKLLGGVPIIIVDKNRDK